MHEKSWKTRLLVVACLIAGCASPRLSQVDNDAAERERWLPQAQLGNAHAQFQLGNSYCCGAGGFYDTQLALRWWCAAAAQNHKAAAQRIREQTQQAHTTVCNALYNVRSSSPNTDTP